MGGAGLGADCSLQVFQHDSDVCQSPRAGFVFAFGFVTMEPLEELGLLLLRSSCDSEDELVGLGVRWMDSGLVYKSFNPSSTSVCRQRPVLFLLLLLLQWNH